MKQLIKLFGLIIIVLNSTSCIKLDNKTDALKNQILPMRERAEAVSYTHLRAHET